MSHDPHRTARGSVRASQHSSTIYNEFRELDSAARTALERFETLVQAKHGGAPIKKLSSIIAGESQVIAALVDGLRRHGVQLPAVTEGVMAEHRSLTAKQLGKSGSNDIATGLLYANAAVYTIANLEIARAEQFGWQIRGGWGPTINDILSGLSTTLLEFGGMVLCNVTGAFLSEYHRHQMTIIGLVFLMSDKSRMQRIASALQDQLILVINVAKSSVVQAESQTLFNLDNLRLGKLRSNSTSSDDSKRPVAGGSSREIWVADLSGKIQRDSRDANDKGGYGDVFKGHWNRPSGRVTIAIKVLCASRTNGYGQTNDQETEDIVRRLRREIKVWAGLNHPNILPLFGIATDYSREPYVSMVSPWYEKGSVHKALRQDPGRLTRKDRLRLICDVATGLAYLHEVAVVHGDLSTKNILLDDEGRARLCDFGLSSILSRIHGICSWNDRSTRLGGAVPYTAPELWSDDNPQPEPTSSSDIYSFGCVMLEILSGRCPFHNCINEATIVIRVQGGARPQREPGLTDDQWSFLQLCWNTARDRPNIALVVKRVQTFYGQVNR